jgi:hypothetical protein
MGRWRQGDAEPGDDLLPDPRPHIKCRVIGPEVVNGMRTWRVIRYRSERGERIAEQVGDRCMSWEEVKTRVNDVLKNKKVIHMGHHRFERRAL